MPGLPALLDRAPRLDGALIEELKDVVLFALYGVIGVQSSSAPHRAGRVRAKLLCRLADLQAAGDPRARVRRRASLLETLERP